MKKKVVLFAAVLGLLLLTTAGAFAHGINGGSQNIGIVTMHAQNGSGEDGSATLTDENGQLMVTVELANGTSTAQPAHIHKGTCANLDPNPAYPLNNVVNGTSTTTLNLTLGDLMSGTYAINVHKSNAEITTYVSCGDLSMMARAGGTNPGTGGTPTTVGMPATGNGEQTLVVSVLALLGLGFLSAGAIAVRKAR